MWKLYSNIVYIPLKVFGENTPLLQQAGINFKLLKRMLNNKGPKRIVKFEFIDQVKQKTKITKVDGQKEQTVQKESIDTSKTVDSIKVSPELATKINTKSQMPDVKELATVQIVQKKSTAESNFAETNQNEEKEIVFMVKEKVNEETTKVNEETDQVNEETAKVNEQTAKVNEQTAKVNVQKIKLNVVNEKEDDKEIPKVLISSTEGKPIDISEEGEHSNEESQKDKEQSWRTMKYSLSAVGITILSVGSYMLIVWGGPRTDENGNTVYDEFSKLPTWKQYLYRMYREVMYYEKLIKEPSREKLLPDVVTYPYYQPPYTLVLELTDVLVHPEWSYQTGWRFKKRPGIDQFLESLSGQFEIVVYTAEMGMTVFPIIEALDPKNLITYKLVRDATHFVDGHHVKDLDKLNRDLSKVIVIDWNQNSTKFHEDNVFRVERWSGNDNDNMLNDLAAFLRTLARWEIPDVRDVLGYYKRFDNPLDTFNERRNELLASEMEVD